MQLVAVLFVRADSIYKTLPSLDCYDAERDARKWPGGCAIIAHPPCRSWGHLKAFAKPLPGEHDLAPWAIAQVRRWGGVVEHPKGSTLFKHCACPPPGGQMDLWGGWVLSVDQFHWGHLARKRTWLYICGAQMYDLPPVPHREGKPTHCISSLSRRVRNSKRGIVMSSPCSYLPEVGKSHRDKTPPDFARWLVELARRCSKHNAPDEVRRSRSLHPDVREED